MARCDRECAGVDPDVLMVARGAVRFVGDKQAVVAVLDRYPHSFFAFVNLLNGAVARVPALCAACLLRQGLEKR